MQYNNSFTAFAKKTLGPFPRREQRPDGDNQPTMSSPARYHLPFQRKPVNADDYERAKPPEGIAIGNGYI